MTISDYLVIAYFAAVVVAMLVLLARGGFWWKPLLILFVLSVCGLMLWYPGRFGPSQRLKPGLDLAGGTVLVYDVRVPPDLNTPTSQVIDETIAVLRERIDPTGTRNLVWRQIAGNRIEIQMALASPETKRRRDAYAEARDTFLAGNLAESKLDAALRSDAAGRDIRLAELVGDNDAKLAQLQALAGAYDAWVVAKGPYQHAERAHREAKQRGDDEQTINDLLDDLIQKTAAFTEARKAFNDEQQKVLGANVTEAELDLVLNLDDKLTDDAGLTARDRGVNKLKADHPDRKDDIDQLVTVWDSYEQVKGELDDPNDLIAMLRGSGVLEFRIAAQPNRVDGAGYRRQLQDQGPRAGKNEPWRWFEIQDIEKIADTSDERKSLRENPVAYFTGRGLVGDEYGGRYYVLLGNMPATAITRASEGWELSDVQRSADDLGQPAVAFSLNAVGGQLMQQLTRPHVGQPMTILLDGKVMNIANIQEALSRGVRITGGTGGFSQDELSYLLRTLRAGSLEGELGEYPISIKTINAKMGEDNIRSGLKAAVGSLLVVAVFILAYYLFAGAVADFALLANMVIILGIMSMVEATWTLPGIAGIVLTIGMAVDANVLIFERIREERRRNADLHTAVRLGYEKAFSTIVDANITTLIVCLVLGYTASAEVKGFAVVLGIGILATLFTSLFCTRVILDFFMDYAGIKSLPMLPTVVPGISRLLSPSVNWIGKRYLFFAFSVVLISAGITAITLRGPDMLDIEFRAGTSVSFELRQDETLPIEDVRNRLNAFGEVADELRKPGFDAAQLSAEQKAVYDQLLPIIDEAQRRYEQDLAEYEQAVAADLSTEGEPKHVDFALFDSSHTDVVTEGATEGGVANAFSISTLVTDPQAVSAVVKAAFKDKLDTTRPIDFASMRVGSVDAAPVYMVKDKNLGVNVDRPLLDVDVTDYVGGVAIVLDEMEPAPTIDELTQRIARMRMQPAFEGLGSRHFEVIGVPESATTGDDGEQHYRTAVVVTRDAQTNYLESPDTFDEPGGLADSEWQLVSDALRRDTSLASVNNFSPAVSGTMQEQAIVALTLSLLAVVAYIWFRFGSFRYGIAAIIALVHDVAVTLGLVALTGWLFHYTWAQALLLEPFKINLALVAAVLTIIGYSLNDTIVVFDRIRENRGRMARATPGIINDSINQTISRTVLTSGSTLLALLVLYIFGGSGVHGFAFAMLIGVFVGTYSSIAIAAPLLLLLGHDKIEDEPASERVPGAPAVPAK